MRLRPLLPVVVSLAVGFALISGAQTPPRAPAAAPGASAEQPFSAGELESMLAPIALYADALLSQVMMASTYPLEVVEAARWRKGHAKLRGKALEDALHRHSWDESVKSLTAFPEVLERMNRDLTWTQKLGDAFLAQQDQVMDTIQSLRARAKAAGYLHSNDQQNVEVRQADNTEYIVIEPANPEIVYVPTYQPTVVYGGWDDPAYPPYSPSYWHPAATPFASGFLWGAGIAAGAALWGGWSWHDHEVAIDTDRYNAFNRTSIGNGSWSHNVNHRGAVPYRDAGSRGKYRQHDPQAAQAREAFRGRIDEFGGAGPNERRVPGDAQRAPGQRDARTAGPREFAADRGYAFAGANAAKAREASSRGHASMTGETPAGGAGRGGGAQR